jgi:hypothetical protein
MWGRGASGTALVSEGHRRQGLWERLTRVGHSHCQPGQPVLAGAGTACALQHCSLVTISWKTLYDGCNMLCFRTSASAFQTLPNTVVS